MRWNVSRNGQVIDTADEATILGWARQGQLTPDMYFQRETGGAWLPIEQTPFAAPNPYRKAGTVIALVGGGLAIVLAVVVFVTPRAPSAAAPATTTAKATHSPEVKPIAELRCLLSIKGDSGAVPVFPTEEGMDEFASAAAQGDEKGLALALRANGGFMVESGTPCTWLDVGLIRTKVRVTDGPHAGRSGWVPSEWSH